MKLPLATAVFAVSLALFSAVPAQSPVVLYDPQTKPPEQNYTEADERLVKTQLLPKAKERWHDANTCTGDDLQIIGAVDGSFTRAGAAQRAVVYELCQTGNGFANNGVAVVENSRVVMHVGIEGGWNLEVSHVPDINRNGRDEIAIETSGGMHQGYMGSSLTVLEMSDTGARELGVYLVYTNECETYVADKYCDRSFKLTATPGPKPVVLAQKYLNRGTDEKPRWVMSGKPATAKQLRDLSTKYEIFK